MYLFNCYHGWKFISEVKYCFILFVPSDSQFFITLQIWGKGEPINAKVSLRPKLQAPQQHTAIIAILAFLKIHIYAIHFHTVHTRKPTPESDACQKSHPWTELARLPFKTPLLKQTATLFLNAKSRMFCVNYLPVFHMIKNWILITPLPIYIHFISTIKK